MLAKSSAFRECIKEAGFTLEVTAPNALFQNCVVERNHCSLGNMMQSMLLSSGLDSTFWSNALLYSVYIKNRPPNFSLPNKISPYEAWYHHCPDLSHLKVFGSLLYVCTPGIKDGKLDTLRIYSGIFLGFTPSTRNVRYLDKETNRTKMARHFTIDKAHFSSKSVVPQYAKDLLKEPGSKEKPFVVDPAKIVPLKFPSSGPTSITPVAASISEDIEVIDSDLYLSSARHGCIREYKVTTKGNDEYLGFHFEKNNKEDIVLRDILKNTPAICLPR